MNGIGIGLHFVAVQTTLLAGFAILLYRILSRKNPLLGGVVLAVFMGLLLLLRVAVFLPLPPWWSAAGIPENSVALTAVPEDAGADSFGAEPVHTDTLSKAVPNGVGISFSPRAFWQGFSHQVQQAQVERSTWLEITALLFLAGCLIQLLRLLLGLLAVHHLRKKSKPLGGDSLRELMNYLQKQLGVHKHVELRESDQIATAATVGWWRPVILLAPCWRLWSPSELQAVLAHELAHVRRGDYLLWLLARFGTALHFYHPLVRWLGRGLRLHQELAADSLAAPAAGGRRSYLLALSQLALRADDQLYGGLAQAFLPAPGTLMRRIQMLQVPEGRRKSWSRLAQAAALCLLFGVALAVTALRHPTPLGAEEQATPANNSDAVASAKTSALEVKPFDLTNLPEQAQGVLAFRPEMLFGRPDMKKITKNLDRVMPWWFNQFGLQSGLELPVTEIEQLVCPIYIGYSKEAPDGQKVQVGFTIQAIRARKKYDWTKLIQKNFPKLTEVKYQGKVYWKISDANPMLFIFGKFLYVPDDRTLVICISEDQARNLIQGKVSSHKIPHWDKVKTMDLAIWFNQPQEVKDYLAGMRKPDPEIALLKHFDSLTLGCTFRKEMHWEGFSDYSTPKAAIQAEKALREAIAEGKQKVTELLKQNREKPDAEAQKLYKIGLDLLQAEIRRPGSTLQVYGQVEFPIAYFLEGILSDHKVNLEE